jgi:hypothetical protein
MPEKLAAYRATHRLLIRAILVALITILAFLLYLAADRGAESAVRGLLGLTALVMIEVVLFD